MKKGFKIIVLAKQVPDTHNVGKDAMKEDGTMNRAALPAIFNPEDLNALEQALRIKDQFPETTITVLSMGLPKAADVITVLGTGVTINAGKGNDLLTTAGGNTFVYASGDGDDVIANFTEDDRIKITSGTPKVTADDSDIKVTVGKGTITLSEAAGQTLYLLDKKDNETEHNPYWFIDDDFTTTPQLADITATTDCMLGEMDIATDPTQLVQTMPIVTASTKK